jgi:hypothetical protein
MNTNILLTVFVIRDTVGIASKKGNSTFGLLFIEYRGRMDDSELITITGLATSKTGQAIRSIPPVIYSPRWLMFA